MSSRSRAGTVVLVGLLATACSSSDGGSGTTGRIISLKTVVNIQGDLTQPKLNGLGWTVAFSQAYLSVGPLYYFAGDPVLSQRQPVRRFHQSALAWLGDLLVRPAHAHPGHYIEGAAMGQTLGATTINLLDTDWYDSEFTYSANWNPGAAARLVPERYVTVGAPRTVLATLSLFVN